MIIPGFLISIATFPGVIVHEFAHQIFCRFCRVAVFEVCYFQPKSPAGYVIHEEPRTIEQQIAIGVGPFFVNSILGGLIAMPAAIPILKFGSGTFFDYFLMWLGISIAMHSFPSTGDAKSMWQAARSEGVFKVWGWAIAPIVGLIYLLALGSFFWLDLAWGVMLALAVPELIIKLFA